MAKTKKCRDCKAEIPKNARKCMHCGSKQGVGLLGGIFAVFFTLMIFGWVVGAINGSGHKPSTAAQQKTDNEPDETQASLLCMQAVRARAKFPSSIDFKAFSNPPAQRLKGGWRIFWAFEAKNGMGNMIPQMARCDVIDGRLKNIHITNR